MERCPRVVKGRRGHMPRRHSIGLYPPCHPLRRPPPRCLPVFATLTKGKIWRVEVWAVP